MRTDLLMQIAHGLRDAVKQQGLIDLVVLCTHNARRSQMAEVILRSLLEHHPYGAYITVRSAGSEATRLHPNTSRALLQAGHRWEIKSGSPDNPHYFLAAGQNHSHQALYSKRIDEIIDTETHYVSLAVCSKAYESCPLLPGAVGRYALPYEDPGRSDGSAQALETYGACYEQMRHELEYLVRALDLA